MRARELIREAEARLSAAGVPDSRFDAEELLSVAAGKERLLLRIENGEIAPEDEARFRALLERRANREPLQYILGKAYFMGLEILCDSRVLIPRFDTEPMCRAAAEELKPGGSLLDLCTGSGAIAAAVKTLRPDARVAASDLLRDALAVARENARRCGCEIAFYQGDLFEPFAGMRFDTVISNPPYIPEGELPELQEEVKREPRLALCGGKDGLDLYRRLIREAPCHLYADGRLYLETGDGETEAVTRMLEEDFCDITVICDLDSMPRALRGTLKSGRERA